MCIYYYDAFLCLKWCFLFGVNVYVFITMVLFYCFIIIIYYGAFFI